MSNHSPIGLFDSGFGGLTVMREVVRLLPAENLIYLGDTARLPYGNKSPQMVLQFAQENAAFLLEKRIKLLMIPCHTACSHALAILQKTLPIPVIGVIQPGLELLTHSSRIAILGTTSTIESGIYQSLIQQQLPHATIYPQACPLFVPLIEEGFHSHSSASLIAESYLSPLKGQIDTALLACTHYPLLRPLLQQTLGPHVKLIEPAERCALLARDYLSSTRQLNPQTDKSTYEFYVTDDPHKFRRLGKLFFGSDIERVEKK
jgi:glutamate racemase